MLGTTLAHYRVLERLGAGGMGTVYRAHDERLGRDVALKVLSGTPGDASARHAIAREAQVLARLSHPHIGAVYELGHGDGTDFIVMELVRGSSLADRLSGGALPTAEALRLARQIADALEEAHAHGVAHRDLKPANVRLTHQGDAKVIDFGLARLLESHVAADETQPTVSGTVAGTVPYMSPEQLRGDAVDGRADVWALGVLLHELLTGKRPFDRDARAETIPAILRDPPVLAASLSPALARVILRCLEKDPGRRYQRAGEVSAALDALDTSVGLAPEPATQRRPVVRRVVLTGMAALVLAGIAASVWVGFRREHPDGTATPSMPHVGSLAVLPLDNLSGDPSQDYFADGMTEALTLEISKLAALQVTSRTSAMRYRRTSKPMPEIARELGVDALLEGSVIRSGNRARVSVQLIHANTDRHLWGERYDRDLGDVLAMQSDVARDIAAQIHLELSPTERARLAVARRVDPAAYDAFLRAREQLTRANRNSIEQSIEGFRAAIAVDAAYAPAWAGLSAAYSEMMIWGGVERGSLVTQQRTALDRALALDPNLPDAQLALGRLRSNHEWNWPEAERAFKRALELNPSYADAYDGYAYFLQAHGRDDEALVSIRRATRLDPLSPAFLSAEGRILYRTRRYEDALDRYRRALQLDPGFQPALSRIVDVYREQRRFDDARAALRELERHGADAQRVAIMQALLAAAAGRRQDALRYAEHGADETLVFVWSYLGDKDKALACLTRAVRSRAMYPFQLRDPGLDPLRADPRFKALVQEVGLPG